MKILLFGGYGMLGTELRKICSDIIAPTRQEIDITDFAKMRDYVMVHNPDLIINASAETDNRKIEKFPANAINTNIIGSGNVSIICRELGIRLVYISTDYIYRGSRGNYIETDEILPFNLYAWTKLGGECSTVAVKNHLIIRTSFGRNTFDYPEAFVDKWVSKDYVDVIAPLIYEASISPLTGVLNLGTERKTLYQHAKERNENVKPVKIADTNFFTPYDNSLNLQKWLDYKSDKSIAKPHSECRICGSNKLIKYLDLGLMPLANNLEFTAVRAKAKERFPLQVLFCEDCSLSQLSVVIDPEKMFSYYTYRSSVNGGYVKHCKQMAEQLKEKLKLNADSFHIDIAGNDGTLLKQFKDTIGLKTLNIDPATNLVAIAEALGIESIADFWNIHVAIKIINKYGYADLITATNVFAHVDNIKDFILSAKTVLKPNGVLVLEFPYLIDFIEGMEFDTCFLPNTLILGANKKIKNCKNNEEIFSSDGSMTQINHVMERNYKGEILKIRPCYIQEINCTPNHPILTAQRINGKMKRNWKNADKIEIDDYLCVPKIKHKASYQTLNLDKYNKYGGKWRRGLTSVKVDESFAYLVGLYTADGSCNVDTISIALAYHERKDIGKKLLKCIKKLGIKPRVTNRAKYGSKCNLYNFSCVALIRLFKDVIGHKAHQKKAPDFILNSKKSVKESYLRGLFDGDGYYKDGQLHLHTSSKILAHQVQLMFASFDVMMGISHTPSAPYKIIGISGYSKGSYQLRARSDIIRKFNRDKNKKSKFMPLQYIIDKDFLYVKVKKIYKRTYEGKVYNFETKSHTYLVNNIAVHNCYFEHLSYMSMAPIMKLCELTGMKVISVEKQNIHGGTIRVTIAHQDATIKTEDSVYEFIKNELKLGYNNIDKYAQWSASVKKIIDDFSSKILQLKKEGYKIAGFGASAKGNTLLNSAGMNTDIINYIADETPEKIGKYSPMTGIPIVNKQQLIKDPPDYLIILSWNFSDEIIEKVSKIYNGKYIIPIPYFSIIE